MPCQVRHSALEGLVRGPQGSHDVRNPLFLQARSGPVASVGAEPMQSSLKSQQSIVIVVYNIPPPHPLHTLRLRRADPLQLTSEEPGARCGEEVGSASLQLLLRWPAEAAGRHHAAADHHHTGRVDVHLQPVGRVQHAVRLGGEHVLTTRTRDVSGGDTARDAS